MTKKQFVEVLNVRKVCFTRGFELLTLPAGPFGIQHERGGGVDALFHFKKFC